MERIAHSAVCSAPAALTENPTLTAEADDVPDDQEIPAKLQMVDELQLAFYLRAGPSRDMGV